MCTPDQHASLALNVSSGVMCEAAAPCSGGTPLDWDKMVGDLAEAYRDHAAAGSGTRWTFITQQEHPVLRQPWYCLHPCETAALMRLLLQTGKPFCGKPANAHDDNGQCQPPLQEDSEEDSSVSHAESVRSSGERVHPGCDSAAHVTRALFSPDKQACCLRDQEPPQLRYFSAWYSTVAHVVLLPCPISLWTFKIV